MLRRTLRRFVPPRKTIMEAREDLADALRNPHAPEHFIIQCKAQLATVLSGARDKEARECLHIGEDLWKDMQNTELPSFLTPMKLSVCNIMRRASMVCEDNEAKQKWESRFEEGSNEKRRRVAETMVDGADGDEDDRRHNPNRVKRPPTLFANQSSVVNLPFMNKSDPNSGARYNSWY